MKISIKVKPNSKVEKVEKIRDSSYSVSVKAPPQEGRANEAVISILSDYFGVPKKRIILLRGASSKQKLIEIIL